MKRLLLFILIGTCVSATAQRRRALVIGIDNYYEQKGQISRISLKGCVNDAMTIEGMLISRMGFKKNEITTLFNEQASRRNIQQGFSDLIDSCRTDDVVFIFYAGHGMYLPNSFSIKEGHSQALLASDVYTSTGSIIRDNEVKTYINAMIDKRAIVTVMFDCCYSGGLARAGPVRETDTAGSVRTITPGQLDIGKLSAEQDSVSDSAETLSRSLPSTVADLKDAAFVQRPEDKPNSRFLFFAAAHPWVESKERPDINDMKHGIFTAAFVDVIKRNKPTISSNEVIQRIDSELARQYVTQDMQGPMIYGDPKRFDMNILGSATLTFSSMTTVVADTVQNNMVTLNGGAAVGLARGNLLRGTGRNAGTILLIKEIRGSKNAAASLKSGSLANVEAGDTFKVINWSATCAPRLKIYLPKTSFFLERYNDFARNILRPGIGDPSFYGYDDMVNRSVIYLYYDQDKWKARAMNGAIKNSIGTMNAGNFVALNTASFAGVKRSLRGAPYFIYLPIPEEISAAIKRKMAANSNVEFVNDAAQANVTLYCSVSKRSGVLSFLCCGERVGDRFQDGFHLPEDHSFQIKSYVIDKSSVQPIASNLENLILQVASFRGWLNQYRSNINPTKSPFSKLK